MRVGVLAVAGGWGCGPAPAWAHLRTRPAGSDLDRTGHVHGVDSDHWRAELAHIDLLVAQLAEVLPAGSVLHVTADGHAQVLLDLVAAPGRTVVFTRTKHRAKKLARQLNAAGVAAVELHGNLSQGARTRTMEAFSSGRADTLVATDIAARGIHVDDVALVVHADPPVEHKAYLHRSGRTARAGAEGTVITLMTDEQVREVRDLTRRAGVSATTTRADARHPILRELAPGERTFGSGFVSAVAAPARPAGRRAPASAKPVTAANRQSRRRRTGEAARPEQPPGRRQTARQTGARQTGARQTGARQTATRQASSPRHGAAAFSAGLRSR